MRKIDNWENVTENGVNKTLPAGIYKLKITDVVDVPEKEYLEIYSDIVDGEFKGYFETLAKNSGKDYSRAFRSYKESALGFFKAFITAVEKTNAGYTWNWDEKSLKGKYFVGVFGEEEYLNQDNEIKTRVRLQEFRSAEALKNGELVVPPLKKLSDEERAKATTTITNVAQMEEVAKGDLPF